MSPRIACIRIPLPTGVPAPTPEARAALVGALLTAAPRVIPVSGHPAAFWADVAGMEGHGGESSVARALARAARDAGWPARVGVAGSCVTAAAATRERDRELRVVPSGRERAYLRRVPLSVLPLPRELVRALALLGVRRCGELAALPPAGIELRFGAEGVRAWRLARGDDLRWPFRPPAPGRAEAEAELDPPVEGTEPLRFLFAGLVAQVTAQLSLRQRIPAALLLSLRTEEGGEELRPIRPARPTADPRVLGDLCRRALESAPLSEPLRGVALAATGESAARADQLDVFAPPAPDPGALHAALLPVFARWGDGACSRAVRHGAHLPAEHAEWLALGSEGAAGVAAVPLQAEAREPGEPPFRNVLPLCLRRLALPLRVEVREGCGHRPEEVSLPPRRKALPDPGMESFPPGLWKTRSQGPERISGGWWGGGDTREYWYVEVAGGWLGLLYRDAEDGRWFLEGWYD